MNLRTGLVALSIASAPMAHAQKAAGTIKNAAPKVERTVEKVGNQWKEVVTTRNAGGSTTVTTMHKSNPVSGKSYAKLNVNAGYSTKEIIGTRVNEPAVNISGDIQSDGLFYVRPSVSLGTTSYEAALPLGLKKDIGKNLSVEGGADLGRIRGFYNKEALTQSEANRVLSGEDCQAMPYKAEFNQNFHAGLRYKNDVVNASVRGEAGHYVYLGRTKGLIKDGAGLRADELAKTDIPIVKDTKSAYVGARADVEVTPFKNKNLSLNAQGAVSTNKSPEAFVGVGYKF